MSSTNFENVPVATNFRASIKKLCPPWLQGLNGYRLMYSFGIQLDAIAEYLRIGVLQRFPSYCETEALSHIGLDRQIQRGPNETDDGYSERLRVAFKTWQYAGHPKAVLGQLAGYFAPAPPVMRYVSNGYDDQGNTVTDWWTLSGGVYTHQRVSPANWDWDGTFGNYRFWVILYLPLLAPWYWDSGPTFDQPGLLWDYQDGGYVTDVKNLIDKWKCAGTHMDNLIIASNTTNRYVRWGEFNWNDGTTWDKTTVVNMFDPANGPGQPMPDGTWGTASNRDTNAQYMGGV